MKQFNKDIASLFLASIDPREINMFNLPAFQWEFHVSRSARDRYAFEETIYATNGNVIFANFHAARQFAQKMNQKRDVINFPERTIQASQINALGLIDEILHLMVAQYRQQRNPQIIDQALEWLNSEFGNEAVEATLLRFAQEFPPMPVYRREHTPEDYLSKSPEAATNRKIALEEMLMLWLANLNPAFAPYLELFDDTPVRKDTIYKQVFTSLYDFFKTQPGFGVENLNLIDLLRAPALASPHSLEGQLEYIRMKWSGIIGEFLYRLLSSLDFIKEEEKAVFLGPGPAKVYEFTGMELEPERFSPDKDWMPSLVLIAKNSYVWLDQLSKQYQRPIHHLDEIPDQELDRLSQAGFTGLWLIGVWERSPASQRIKQLRGNPEAVASAYSLFSYDIAADLGGEEAYLRLKEKAWKKGIRLASDMVPNHMGIDSRWIIEHPDWFISLNYSPFPSYTFNGPNLSWENRVGIYLEDHYFDNTDAAVVFKRVDFWTGDTKFIYHGNDGTSMPWNDTAQLNYLDPEVREAVIQTILHVARKFPIIRFDAAMTLAKKHYQRLWFPEPGSGGDIPSRSEHGLTREQFDAAMPVEFWRELVDRVAQEVPDTLLLAEAFWLMEGYFVRTLGMHRVYNSAFMNMLRDEKNQEYRSVIKNTIEFEPEILKRYVNFMNNPDERTAVDQFGKGDKYFGICVMMSTLPGLPMFGHGQIEGFSEKYGMEYRRAYWDEHPDEYLVSRHQREIFPLLRKRYLFADSNNFRLFDFFTPDGYVDENVYAYTNQAGGERALVIYHNKYASTRGYLRVSASYPLHSANRDDRTLVQTSLGETLSLCNSMECYTIFRDQITGLEYIHNSLAIHQEGLYLELDAYQCHVFMNFRDVVDDDQRKYAQLASFLDGRGVPDIDEALKEIILQPVHQPFTELFNPGQIKWLIQNRLQTPQSLGEDLQYQPFDRQPLALSPVLDEIGGKAFHLLKAVKALTNAPEDPAAVATLIELNVAILLNFPVLDTRLPLPHPRNYKSSLDYLHTGLVAKLSKKEKAGKQVWINGAVKEWSTMYAWICTRMLGQILDQDQYAGISRAWIDEWLLGKLIVGVMQDLGVDEVSAWQAINLVKILVSHQDWYQEPDGKISKADSLLKRWLEDHEFQRYMGVNRYQGILWFNHERFNELLWWMYATSVISIASKTSSGVSTEYDQVTKMILKLYALIREIQRAESESEYQVEKLLQAAT